MHFLFMFLVLFMLSDVLRCQCCYVLSCARDGVHVFIVWQTLIKCVYDDMYTIMVRVELYFSYDNLWTYFFRMLYERICVFRRRNVPDVGWSAGDLAGARRLQQAHEWPVLQHGTGAYTCTNVTYTISAILQIQMICSVLETLQVNVHKRPFP